MSCEWVSSASYMIHSADVQDTHFAVGDRLGSPIRSHLS